MEQLDLSNFFTTKAQATDFSTRLATVAEKVYETQFNLEKTLMEQIGIAKKDKFLVLLRENNIASDSSAAVKEFIGKLQEYIASLSVLTLTIAFEPKEQTLQAFTDWFLMNSHKQVLFDIHIDTTLIAGATFSINGKYYDFSIRKIFQETLNNTVVHKVQPATTDIQTPKPVLGNHQNINHITLGR